MSDSDVDPEPVAPVKPPPKRRRIIIDPSAISSVPIYSNRVNSCLRLKPTPTVLAHHNSTTCDAVRPEAQRKSPTWTDSEEEEEHTPPDQTKTREGMGLRSPSPPLSPGGLPVQLSTRVWRTMDEVNSRLGSISSLLSLSPEGVRGVRTRGGGFPPLSPPVEPDDPLVGREVPLKFRCRTEIHRVPVMSSRPLAEAVEVLSVKLKVPPSRILLLRNERELPAHSSANQLGLSIADIIDCVVIAEDVKQDTQGSDIITVRLQGKDRGSTQQYSLHKEASLGSILSQYAASQSAGGGAKLQFLFDGSKIKASHTPAQLDMEDGDVIEVWS